MTNRPDTLEQMVGQEEVLAQPAKTVVGKAELEQLLGVKRGTVYKWTARQVLPPADMVVNGQDAWWSTTILEWARTTGRERSRRDGYTASDDRADRCGRRSAKVQVDGSF
jgi:predicted DNA-binding transcriptional regulator AlpA